MKAKRKIVTVHRRLALACAGVAAALTAPTVRAATPEVIYDLRLVGGGKSADLSTASGDNTVSLELFALVKDVDLTASNTGFNAAQGLWTSSNGGMLGNLTTSLISPFDYSSGAQNPSPVDRDGDGDLDVGNIASASSGFWIASADPTGSFTNNGTETIGADTYRRFKIGTGTFTVSQFDLAGTSLNFVPRTGNALVKPHKYWFDNTGTITSINGNDSRLSVAAPISLQLDGLDYTWSGTSGGSWGAPSNWGNVGVPGSVLDNVTFTPSGAGTVLLDGSRTVRSLTFTAAGYQINPGSGGMLTIKDGAGGGGISATNGFNISSSIAINADNLGVTIDSGDGAPAGLVTATSITKDGNGRLILGTSSSLSSSSIGAIVVNGGTVQGKSNPATGANGLGTATVTLESGTTLQVRAQDSFNFGNNVILNGSASINADRVSAGPTDETLTLGSLTVANGATVTAGAVGTGSYSLVFSGATALSGSNTFVVSPAGDLALNGAVTGTATLTKSGTGSMYLGGSAANTFAGETIVDQGTLLLNKTSGADAIPGNVTVNSGGTLIWLANEQVANSADMTLNSGGVIDLNGFTETVNAFVDNGGSFVTGGGTLNVLAADITITDGTNIATTVNVPKDVIYTGTTTPAILSGPVNLTNTNATHTFDINNGSADPDVTISGVISGSTGIVKAGSGSLLFSSPSGNNYTGPTSVVSGKLILAGGSSNPDVKGSLTVGAFGVVEISRSNAVGNTSAINIANGGQFKLNGYTDSVGSLSGAGSIMLGSGGTLITGGDNVSSSFSGVISGDGTFGYNGNGVLMLTGNNTLTGTISIATGTVAVSSAQNFGSAIVAYGDGGTLRADGTFSTATTIRRAYDGDGMIEVTSGNTLTTTGGFDDGLVAGPGGSMVKTGGGTLNLAGSGSASGAMRIDAGTVAVSGTRALLSDVAISSGGTLDLTSAASQTLAGVSGSGAVLLHPSTATGLTVANSSTRTFSGTMTGGASFTKDGAAAMVLTGSVDTSGSVSVNSGTMTVTGAGAIIADQSVTSAATLDITSGGTVITPVAVANLGTINVAGGSLQATSSMNVGTSGSGVLNVTSGGVVAVAGTLDVADVGTSALNLSGGSLTVGALDTSGAPSRVNWTAGSLAITGTSAGLIVQAGQHLGSSLSIDASKQLSVASSLIVGDTANGTLTQTGGSVAAGTHVSGSYLLSVGHEAGATGTYNLSGTGVLSTNHSQIGDRGTGIFNQSGGSHIVTQDLFIGIDNASVGTYQLTGGNLQADEIRLATFAGSSGSLTVANASASAAGIRVGGYGAAGGTGTLTVNSGGSVTSTGGLFLWESAASAITVNSGGVLSAAALQLSGNQISLASAAANPGTLLLTSGIAFTGTSGTGAISSTGANSEPGTIDLNALDQTISVANGSAAVDLSINARISNGGITKSGAGVLQLGGANEYSGPTAITAGTIRLAVANAIPAASAVTITGSALLDLNGLSDSIGSLADGGSGNSGSVVLGAGRLTVGGDNTSTTFLGAISGTTGGITKEGTGALTLEGQQNFSGDMIITGGTLRLLASNSGFTGDVVVSGNGPAFGTLSMPADNLGNAASVTFGGGHLATESTFTINRAIKLDLGGGYFDVNSGHTLTLGGTLSDVGLLTKDKAGTLVLGNANTYTGQTSIALGTLQTNAAGALPAASPVNMNAAATLQLLGGHNQTIASLAGSGAINLGSATLTSGGNDATTNFAGSISGTGGLVKAGSGTLTLDGNLSFGGGVVVNGGTLALTGSGTFGGSVTVNSGAALSIEDANGLGATSNAVDLNGGALHVAAAPGSVTLANPISITTGGTIEVDSGVTLVQTGSFGGSGTFQKTGTGSMRLDDATSFAGSVAINGGTVTLRDDATATSVTSFMLKSGGMLELDNFNAVANSDRIGDSTPVTLAGGTLKLNGADGVVSTESAGTLNLGPGSSSIILQQNGALSGTTLTFATLGAVDPGASLDVTAPGAGTTNKLILTSLNGSPGFLGGWATVNGTDFAQYDFAQGGWIPLTGYSTTFVGATQTTHVRLDTSEDPPVGVNDINTLTLDTSVNTVNVTLNAATFSVHGGGILKSGTNPSTISGGKLTSPTGRLDVRTSGAGLMTVASGITGNVNFVKSGTGILELTSTDATNHNFTGGVYINGGTLRITSDLNLGATAANGNDVFFNGGTLQVNGGTGYSLNSNRTLTVNAAGGVIDVQASSITLGGAGQFAGSGMLTKTGAGSLILSGQNTFDGPLTLSNGVLALRHVNALGTGSNKSTITMTPGSQLDLRSDDAPAANFGNNIIVQPNSGGTDSALITTGRISTAGTNGAFQLGSLRIGNATVRHSGADGWLEFNGIVTLTGDINSIATFETLNSNDTKGIKLTDRVTGGGSLRKAGPTGSTLTLGGGALDDKPNTYAGDTIITGGTLVLDKKEGTNAIPGNITMDGGSLVLVRNYQIAASSVVSMGGGTFNLNVDQAVKTINRTGGIITVSGSKVTVGTSTWGNGEIGIGDASASSEPGGGGPGTNVSPQTSAYDTDILTISNGLNEVLPGGTLNVGSGGLFFEGPAGPTILLHGNAQDPGEMTLAGDVTNNATGAPAQVLNAGTTTIAGTISLGDAVRTFTVANATSDLRLDARIIRGGIRKSGVGKLILMQPSELQYGITIAGGTVEAHDGALGHGPITLSASTAALHLRSDQPAASLLNDVTTSSATIDVDRISGEATPHFKLGRLSIGANRLTVTGANGSLEFVGDVALTAAAGFTATFDNSAPVTISGAITGNANLTKDTRSGVLRLAGTAANTYTGLTRVNNGTLDLAKPPRINAIAGNVSAFSEGTVRWQASDQVVDSSIVTVNGEDARVDLNGFNDTIGQIQMTGGTIDTFGAASFAGVIRLLGDLTTFASTNTATISGKLDLGTTIHTFNVGDSVSSPADDLVVSADVSGAGGGINKAGPGTLVLSGNNSFTGGVTVTGGTLKTSGASTFTGAQSLAISAGNLDMPGAWTTAAGAVVTKTGAGALSISGTQSHGANSQIRVQGGSLNVNTNAGPAGARTLNINATTGAVVFNASQNVASINAESGVTVTVTPGGDKVVHTNTLSLANTAKLNLGTGTLIVEQATAGTWNGTGYTGVRGLVAAGSNGGNWNGNGIITGQSSATGSQMLTTLAVASAGEMTVTSFEGHDVTPTAVIVKYTLLGDADMNEVIDGDDFFRIDSNVGKNGQVFGSYNGDFDSNGRIDTDDYFWIHRNYSRQGQVILAGAPAMVQSTEAPGALAGVAAVPEPSALATMMAGGALALRRRRRARAR